MDEQHLIAQWKAEEQEPFSGWDFAHLKGRHAEEAIPWSYGSLVRGLLADVDSVLDMGTGGGETLLGFRDALPAHTVATEGYAPNVPIARANLEPAGIPVYEYDSETDARLPFEDNTFGLIINRHEAFDAGEVARVLRPSGVFFTQQVDGRDLDDLAAAFDHPLKYLHVTLENCRHALEQAGLYIERAEAWTGKTTFADVGAMVYFMRAAPWIAPDDFSVERYATHLLRLHREHQPLAFTIRRFYIQARKPAL